MNPTLLLLISLVAIAKCQLFGINPSLPVPSAPKLPVTPDKLFPDQWKAFSAAYEKSGLSEAEKLLRREIFTKNIEKIDQFNKEFDLGQRTFVQKLNNFADMVSEEFNRVLNGFNPNLAKKIALPKAATFVPSPDAVIPEQVDWREKGAVGPVKSQGMCASCYAFSAAGALEGQIFRKTGKLLDLSPQNLVDCSTKIGNEGCSGGLMEPAFEYIRTEPGISTESAYTYEGKNNTCKFKKEDSVAECKGYMGIASGDEKALEAAVATLGPISVAMDAGQETFQFYSDGVYYDPKCRNRPEDVNHAVLVVGYGKEPSGQKYWLIKNSYGTQWGKEGYFKLAKDVKNHCGIAVQPSYPLV